MKKSHKKAAIFAILFLVCLMLPASVQAAGNGKAKKAFRDFLSKSRITWSDMKFKNSDFQFKYYEIGKKKKPILIVKNNKAFHYQGYCGVYQYINGKVKFVTAYDRLESIYVKSGVLVFCYSGGGYGEINRYYYKLNNRGNLTQIAYSAILDKKTTGSSYAWCRKMFGKDKYQWNGKKVSKSTFNSNLKKQVKNSKKAKPGTLYKNTAANRKKYLK